MLRFFLLTLLFSSTFLAPAHAGFLPENLDLQHTIQQETSYRVAAAPAFTKLLSYYQIEANYRYSSAANLTAIGRFSYEPIHDLQNLEKTNPFQSRFEQSSPRQISEIDPFDAELKEFYGNVFFDSVDLRIGKQISRWGVIEGFRITDEINPIDFDEFILRPLTDRYIPLWMIKTDSYFQDMTLQIIWIPELKFHKPAPPGSEFEQFQDPPGLIRPANTFENTEIALRLSGRFKDYDLALSFFEGWDDFPTASQTIFGLGQGTTSSQSADAVTQYHRIKTFGFTFTKSIGAEIIKGEFAFVSGRAFGTLASSANNNIAIPKEIERPQFKYGLGWDTRLPFGIETFLQFSQQWIQNHEDFIIADALDSGASLVLRKKFLNEALLLKFLAIYMVNDKELMLRPRIRYRWTDHTTLAFGADIFEGKEGNIQQDDFRFIGFFDKNDRIYTEVRYSF